MNRAAGVYLVLVLFASLLPLATSAPVRASLCEPGWVLISDTPFDFTYGRDAQGFQVWWTGDVDLQEQQDRNCNWLAAELIFTGSSGGATLIIAGNAVYASFTVQTVPFSDHNHVGDNAIGRIISSSPVRGTYSSYSVSITAWPAGDEYEVISSSPSQTTITGNQIVYSLPTSSMGQTVYAEISAGPNLKNDWRGIVTYK